MLLLSHLHLSLICLNYFLIQSSISHSNYECLFLKCLFNNFVFFFFQFCRLLNEKREAFDAIELLKLISKHNGFVKQHSGDHQTFSPTSSLTSLSTMSSFSSCSGPGGTSSVINKGSSSSNQTSNQSKNNNS